jgi:hypothetical protein
MKIRCDAAGDVLRYGNAVRARGRVAAFSRHFVAIEAAKRMGLASAIAPWAASYVKRRCEKSRRYTRRSKPGGNIRNRAFCKA